MFREYFSHRPTDPEMSGRSFGQWVLFLWVTLKIKKTGEIVGLLVIRASFDLLKHHLPVPPFNSEEIVTDIYNESVSVRFFLLS